MPVSDNLRFLFLEPFYGGSHRDFADGLTSHSRHDITLVTLPDRFWKWRMRGAAIYWADRIKDPGQYDGLIVSSLLNLADLKALWGQDCPPTLVYFHENQLTYPSAPGERPDYQPGFTNITTALAGQRLLFNSRTHLDAFLAALPEFIRIMPDFRPKWVVKTIAGKSGVAYPGCHLPADLALDLQGKTRPPLIIWNHRWEHDKNPEDFFRALAAMDRQDIDFQVALLGEDYERMPEVFKQAPGQLGPRLVQYGWVPSRDDYYQWLNRGSIVISTACQENFGIAAVEAMRLGCLPLLPERLSYPEIVPRPLHDEFLYRDQDDLEHKLKILLTRGDGLADQRRQLGRGLRKFAWETAVELFDEELSQLAAGHAAGA